MKKAVIIFLTFYYGFAVAMLPLCDFSIIADFPEMYKNCKETEDQNLSSFYFITEHLVDFDNLFEEEKEQNKEKPHKQIYHHCQFVNYVTSTSSFRIKTITYYKNIVKHSCKKETYLLSTFYSNILRPPIV